MTTFDWVFVPLSLSGIFNDIPFDALSLCLSDACSTNFAGSSSSISQFYEECIRRPAVCLLSILFSSLLHFNCCRLPISLCVCCVTPAACTGGIVNIVSVHRYSIIDKKTEKTGEEGRRTKKVTASSLISRSGNRHPSSPHPLIFSSGERERSCCCACVVCLLSLCVYCVFSSSSHKREEKIEKKQGSCVRHTLEEEENIL